MYQSLTGVAYGVIILSDILPTFDWLVLLSRQRFFIFGSVTWLESPLQTYIRTQLVEVADAEDTVLLPPFW